MAGQSNNLKNYRAYVVVLQNDDAHPARYYIYAESPDRAKELACRAEVAPPGAVLSVRLGGFEEAGR